MKKHIIHSISLVCMLCLCASTPLFAAKKQSLSAPRKDDFEDITNLFQIRSVRNGIAINVLRSGNFMEQNWILKEFFLSDDLRIKRDKLRKSWDFGYVQFVSPTKKDGCLAIDESGFLKIKSCKDDIASERLETVFSIIPTESGAVQIRSLVLNSTECLSTFENPNVPIEKRFGIVPCSLDFDFFIDTSELFFFTPALIKARPLGG